MIPSDKIFGEKLSTLVINLCANEECNDFIKQMHLNPIEAERLRFCLLIFNIAMVTWSVNISQHKQTSRILDYMLADILEALEQDNRPIRIGDFIFDRNEVDLIDVAADENTETTYYNLLVILSRVQVCNLNPNFREIAQRNFGFNLQN